VRSVHQYHVVQHEANAAHCAGVIVGPTHDTPKRGDADRFGHALGSVCVAALVVLLAPADRLLIPAKQEHRLAPRRGIAVNKGEPENLAGLPVCDQGQELLVNVRMGNQLHELAGAADRADLPKDDVLPRLGMKVPEAVRLQVGKRIERCAPIAAGAGRRSRKADPSWTTARHR